MPIRVLVYGWYGHGNVGDELFRDAFRQLMPEAHLTFVDKIKLKDLEGQAGIVFGGGSFLYKEPWLEAGALPLLMELPTAYAGVGVEKEVHPIHQELMKKSVVVATRTAEGAELLRSFGADAMFSPDIVHLLKKPVSTKKISKSLMLVTNVEVIPTWNAPSWSQLAWERYKNEMAQFLDERLELGWNVSFFSMCKNPRMNDLWGATEILGKMTRRSTKLEMIQGSELSNDQILEEFSKRSVVLTQRYHGAILAEMVDTPCVAIHHHDKIKNVEPFRGSRVPYYEFAKRPLHEAVDVALQSSSPAADMQPHFTSLKKGFEIFLKEAGDGQVRRHTER